MQLTDENRDKLSKLKEGGQELANISKTAERKPFRADGYVNMLNKYGLAQDNSTAYGYMAETLIPDETLTTHYESNGLFAKIIDIPAQEAVKKGFHLNIEDENVEEYIQKRVKKVGWSVNAEQALKWSRLYGGAIGVMILNDGCSDLSMPVNWKKVKGIEEIVIYDRSCVTPDYHSLYNDYGGAVNNHSKFRQPEFYNVFSVYGSFRVHESRCLVFKNGVMPEKASSMEYRFWGTPEYARIKRELREAITAHGYSIRLLERCVQAVYKMQNLSQLLGTDEGEDQVLRRLQVIDMARSILNSIAIDSTGEDYDFRSISLTGVKEVIESACNMLSAVTEIPQTKLFGRSPAGMNSTGESDLENYYNFIDKIREMQLKDNLCTLVDIIIQIGVNKGELTGKPEYELEFDPLWNESESEKANVEQVKAATDQVKAQTAQIYMDMGVLDPAEIRKGLKEEGKYNIEDEALPEQPNPLADLLDQKPNVSTNKDSRNDGEWKESDHPRDENGRFTSGNGSTNVKSVSESTPHTAEINNSKLKKSFVDGRDEFDKTAREIIKQAKVGTKFQQFGTTYEKTDDNEWSCAEEKSKMTDETIRDLCFSYLGGERYLPKFIESDVGAKTPDECTTEIEPHKANTSKAIYDYQNYGYVAVNEGLRDGKKLEGKAKEIDAGLQYAFSKTAPIKSDMHVMRDSGMAVTSKAFEETGLQEYLSNSLKGNESLYDAWLIPENRDEIRRKLIGYEFEEKGYTSSTTSQDFLKDFSYGQGANDKITPFCAKEIMSINIPKGSRVLDLGEDGFITGSGENEVILNRGARYRIREVGYSHATESLVLYCDYLQSDRKDSQDDMLSATGVGVIVIKDGKVLIGNRSDNGEICGPGGHVESWEDAEEAARRETREEFGIEPNNLVPVGLLDIGGDYGRSYIFLSTEFSGEPFTDTQEMANCRFTDLYGLNSDELYLPFKLSLELIAKELGIPSIFDEKSKNLQKLHDKGFTSESDSAIINNIETDGGPGSGKKPEGGHRLSRKDIEKFKKRFIGFKTSDGHTIKSVSNHAFDRVGGRLLPNGRVERMLTEGKICPGHTLNTQCYDVGGSRLVLDTSNGKIVTIMWRHGK